MLKYPWSFNKPRESSRELNRGKHEGGALVVVGSESVPTRRREPSIVQYAD